MIPLAQRLSVTSQGSQKNAPILLRMDTGFDAARLMSRIESCNQGRMGSAASAGGVHAVQVHFLIKWNPRSTDMEAMATWEHAVTVDGVQRPVRRVLRLIERTIDKRGQVLLVPELTLDVWTTSLPADLGAQDVIGLYADHGTHEQFHSEFKTDLDLTRLPSGKVGTNYLVCQLAAVAMNILRLMGQSGLLGPDAPVRHPAKRRRIKTVMQELVYRAGRLIQTGRRLFLELGQAWGPGPIQSPYRASRRQLGRPQGRQPQPATVIARSTKFGRPLPCDKVPLPGLQAPPGRMPNTNCHALC